jgi:hypothetical protein
MSNCPHPNRNSEGRPRHFQRCGLARCTTHWSAAHLPWVRLTVSPGPVLLPRTRTSVQARLDDTCPCFMTTSTHSRSGEKGENREGFGAMPAELGGDVTLPPADAHRPHGAMALSTWTHWTHCQDTKTCGCEDGEAAPMAPTVPRAEYRPRHASCCRSGVRPPVLASHCGVTVS